MPSDPAPQLRSDDSAARGIVSAACGCALHTLVGLVIAQPCVAHLGQMRVEMVPRPPVV